MLKKSHGVSTIGCLLVLAIVVAGFYVGYKFAVVQWNLESFKEELTELTRYWTIEREATSVAAIKADVIRRAERCNFSLEEEDIDVNIEGPSVTVRVSWFEPIIFPGGYTYQREITISRTIRKPGR